MNSTSEIRKMLVGGGIVFLLVFTLGDYAQAQSWSTTGSMAHPRFAHTATVLNNRKVLVTGGVTNSSVIPFTELYDPDTGAWTPAATMGARRAGHTATLLRDGKVLVAGGVGWLSSRSAELYDPSNDTWSITGSMNDDRIQHEAVLLADGRVLVTGSRSSAEIYDPDTGTWEYTISPNLEETRTC